MIPERPLRSKILKLAVDLLKSTNWCIVDLDQHSQFQIVTSSLRTKKSLTKYQLHFEFTNFKVRR
jgi:hypothetical protein